MNAFPSGLYVITDPHHASVDELVGKVHDALAGGARVVQYRDKSHNIDRRLAEATRLRDLCDAWSVPLIINDDVALARQVGAAGVHLGKNDLTVADARAQMPPGALIGCSCYNQFELGVAAAAAGADYIAFGSFFSSPTKPDAVPASLDLLRQARRELGVPTVAIGGITPENGAALVAAGASLLAVISAVFAASDINGAASAFARCFKFAEETPS